MSTTGTHAGAVSPGITPVLTDVSNASRSSSCEPASPIFLHSSFRTGSTWLWQKLRNAPTTFCYYEIFNEVHATLNVDYARSLDHSSWASRHPVVSPYFLEFVPRIANGGGVLGFDGHMSLDDFIPADGPDGALRPAEKAYLDGLIETAWSMRRIPVLSCTRSLGRARALRAAFGGQTIFLHRNLFHQWVSYWSLAESGNRYFVDTVVKTVLASGHDPLLRHVAARFELDRSVPCSETLFQIFIVLHLYLYSIAYDASDLIVDLTAMSRDQAVRDEAERRLSGMTGHAIDLSDIREQYVFPTFIDASPQRVRDVVEELVKEIPTGSITPEAIAFVQRTMQSGLSEWDRFEFFNTRMRSALTAAKSSENERDAKIEGLEVETARLTLALGESRRELAALKAGIVRSEQY